MTFWNDIRFAARMLRKSPGFFLLAVATLGVGIAANTAIFSLFHQVLMRSLPTADPSRLFLLHSDEPNLPGRRSADNSESVVSYPLYLKVRDQVHSFSGVAARSSTSVQFSDGGDAERTRAEVISGNFFSVLGIQPRLGRLISPGDEAVRGGNGVTVLSYGLWMRRFGGSTAVLNRVLTVNGQPFTVVGVAPEEFRGIMSGDRPDLYLPISMYAAITPGWNEYENRADAWLSVFGRLAPGVTRERATAELQPVFAQAIREAVEQIGVKSARTRALLFSKKAELHSAAQGINELERQWSKPLIVLLGMVSLLLLIGCANLANLLLARGVNRSREIAVRLALGASPQRIVSLLAAESLLVAICGAATGLALAPMVIEGILRLLPEDATSGWLNANVSMPVMAFCAALMLATALLSGLGPALQALRGNAQTAFGDRSAGTGGKLPVRTRQVLVAGQIALSLVLLCSAGLFGKSLVNLLRHSPGFQPGGLLTFSMDAGLGGYSTERGVALYRDMRQKLEALPGVESVSMTQNAPLSNSSASTNVMVEGYAPTESENMDAEVNEIGPGLFRTLGAPLIAGREFDDRDTITSSKTVIVNQAFVDRFLSKRNPIGMHMSRGSGGKLDLEIVGVVGNMQSRDFRTKPTPAYFQPYPQASAQSPRASRMTFFVRTRTGLEALPSSVRHIAASLNASLPVFNIQTMTQMVDNSISTDRLIAALASAFALLAAGLSAVGLYGVIAYVVGRRTAEIGVRMALGATRKDVAKLVLREVAAMTAFGVGFGLLCTAAASKAIAAMLFGISGFDPLVAMAAVLLLGGVALAAGAVPAWRAARVEPLTALRHQ